MNKKKKNLHENVKRVIRSLKILESRYRDDFDNENANKIAQARNCLASVRDRRIPSQEGSPDRSSQ